MTVEFLETDTRVGGREVSLCKVEGQPDIRCENGWLELQPQACAVNYEVISSEGVTQSAALVTADMSGTDERSRLVVTVQLSSLAEDMDGKGIFQSSRHPDKFGVRTLPVGTEFIYLHWDFLRYHDILRDENVFG